MASKAARILGITVAAVLVAITAYRCSTEPPITAAVDGMKTEEGDFPKDAASIRNAGFNCPAAFRKSAYPPDAYGKVQRVFCALGGENYVSFRATQRPNGSWLIAPW